MVFADRSLKAGSYEIKSAYQPIRTRYENGVLSVRNRLDFTDLKEFTFRWWIEADGKRILEKQMVLEAPPHAEVTVPAAWVPGQCRYGVYLNTSLEKNGTEYARTQHALPALAPPEETCKKRRFCGRMKRESTQRATGSATPSAGITETLPAS